MWDDLPLIQKEIAVNLITNFELNQLDVAENFGRTPVAVCQYLSHKRGNMKTPNLELVKKKKINISADPILNNTNEKIIEKTPYLQNFHCERNPPFCM